MAEQKIVDGDYYIICDNGAGNLNIIANVDITGTLTYSNVVTVNAAFFTVAEGNPGTIYDMGMLAQTGPATFAGLRYHANTGSWQVSNSVNSVGAPIVPYLDLLTAGSNLIDPNIGNATGVSLTLSNYLQTVNHVATGNSIVSGWSNVGNLNSLGVVQSPLANIAVINTSTINASSTISTTGQIIGSDIVAAGVISGTIATISDRVTANAYYGDGGHLSNINASNIAGSYSNVNVAAFLPTYTGNISASSISASGNITGNMIIGNGALLTGLPTGYSNANVAAFLPTYTGDVSANSVVTIGNITGSYIFGNGSQLIGLPAGYSNTDLANIGANSISTTGSVSAGYFVGDGGNLTGLPAGYTNANVANYLPVYSGDISVDSLTGNVVNVANVISTSVAFSNVTKSMSLTNPMAAFIPTTLTIPDPVSAVNFNWVLKSSSGDAVSTGKGFAAANTSSVSVTYYGNSTVGSGLGSISVSGNSSALTFTASAGTVGGTFILMVTEYLS